MRFRFFWKTATVEAANMAITASTSSTWLNGMAPKLRSTLNIPNRKRSST